MLRHCLDALEGEQDFVVFLQSPHLLLVLPCLSFSLIALSFLFPLGGCAHAIIGGNCNLQFFPLLKDQIIFCNFTKRLFDLSKKFACLAAKAVFVSSFLIQKQLIYDFSAVNNYPNSPHLQGCMKFATQISPLLNYLFTSNMITEIRIIERGEKDVYQTYANRVE